MLFNELIDIVIDHLHDDKDSLESCSLVSSTFRNSSQYHLLEKVSLTGVTSSTGLESFMAFVEKSPRFGHYVRTVRVFGEGSWFGKYNAAESRERCLGPKHLRFLSQLPALRRLFLFELLWDSNRDGPAGLSMIHHDRPSGTLEKLVMQHMTSLRFQQPGEIHHGIYAQDVLDVLSFFSDVHVLNFSTPRFEVDAVEEGISLGIEERFLRLRFPRRLRVRELVADPDALDTVRSALAYTLLDRACSAKSLHSFRAKVKPGDLDAISHFVDARASSILHYYLDLSAYFTLSRLSRLLINSGPVAATYYPKLGANETFSLLRLPSCSNLECFELRTPCYPPERLWYYILTALSKLPTTIRSIKICVYLTSTLPNSLEAACQGAVSTNLDYMEHFPHLEELEFSLRHPYGSDAVYPYRYQKCKKMLEEAVPEALREKVLRISPCECFRVPTPEPVCLSVFMQSPSLS